MLFTVLALCALVVRAIEPECGVTKYGSAVLVVGGKPARRGEVPWHAGIYRKSSTTYTQICGGSLISNSVIISAAHCFWNGEEEPPPPKEFAAAVGKIYRGWESNATEYDQKSDVKEIHIPDHYQGSNGNYQEDLAVVVVISPFQYTQYVSPICVHFDARLEKRQLQPGNYGKVAGWGLTETGLSSQVLRLVQLPYIDIKTCIMVSPFTFLDHITGDKFCAGFKDSNTAVCLGDSGGGLAFPLTENGRTRYYLRGVVSSAPDTDQLCNTNEFTAFTHLLKHEHFIKEIWELEQAIEAAKASNVCYPLPATLTSPKTGQKAWDKCIEYQEKLVYPCSDTVTGGYARIDRCHLKTNELLTGEEDVHNNKFPHFVQIGSMTNNTFYEACSGTLISEKFVLTSGSCTVYLKIYNVTVYVGLTIYGTLKERNDFDDLSHFRVKHIHEHPEFNFDKNANDITLLELEKPLILNDFLVPACLHTGDSIDDDSVVALAWRKDFKEHKTKLRKLIVTKSTQCFGDHGGYHDAKTQLCYRSSDTIESECYVYIGHAYGGPLQVKNKKLACMNTIVGVSSRYLKCRSDLRTWVFARVSSYLDWIEKMVWP